MLSLLPHAENLILMLVNPLIDLQYHFSRRFSIHEPVYDRYTAFIIPICKVYMGRIIISPI